MTQATLQRAPSFICPQISPPEAYPSRFASFTQSGETKGSALAKALNSTAAPTRAGANP